MCYKDNKFGTKNSSYPMIDLTKIAIYNHSNNGKIKLE